MPVTYNGDEIDILRALALRSRVLTREQIAKGWFEGDVAEAEDAMKRLCSIDQTRRLEVYAHPLVEMSEEFGYHWKPGNRGPTDREFKTLAEYFQGRWDEAEEQFVIYVATKDGANSFGSYVLEPPTQDQLTHDIHVGEIYVEMKTKNPETADRIVGEGCVPKLGKMIHGAKDPDLFIVNDIGKKRSELEAMCVIEFAGSYTEKHLRLLHGHLSGEAHWKLKRRFPDHEHLLYPDPRGTQYFLL